MLLLSTMDYYFTSILYLLLLAVVASHAGHAATPAQVYWKSVLPNTPMPNAIKDLLPTDVEVGVKSGGVHVDTGKGAPGGTTVDVGHKGVGVSVGGKGDGTTVDVGGKGSGKGGVGVSTGPYKGNPPVVVTVPYAGPFSYKYAATETQLRDDPNVALFFLEKDLDPDATMTLHFTKTTTGGAAATFLPQGEANSIPFSSEKLPEILTKFSINPSSLEAKTMKNTLQECEAPSVKGESKHCATSLQSMVEFSTLSLGTRDIQAVSTMASEDSTAKQEYKIAPPGAKRLAGSKLVSCHSQAYAYAVFYCHATSKSRAYVVPLVGKDGTKVEAVAVCHTDTAAWNPKHLAFQVLKVKPGTVPVCHFLPQDHVVWTLRK